jgi:hypothetical protein
MMRGAAKCEQRKNLHQSNNPEQLFSELEQEKSGQNTPAMRMPPAAGQSLVGRAPCLHQWSKREIAAVKKQAVQHHAVGRDRHTRSNATDYSTCDFDAIDAAIKARVTATPACMTHLIN